MNSIFNKPEYIFQPDKIFMRFIRLSKIKFDDTQKLSLPWKAKLKINPNEVLGRSIWIMGIYDLSVTEVIWRLTSWSETAIDVGANIGYMTSIMARKVGKHGKVYCFEPHPQIYQNLSENIINWQNDLGWNQIDSRKIAITNCSGEGYLKIPNDFEKNRGLASLCSSSEIDNYQSKDNHFELVYTNLVKLDEIITSSARVDILKIDVEGHELGVLEGCQELIKNKKIRDIVFEEHHHYPSPVTKLLEYYGYTIFRICKGFWKPILRTPISNQDRQLSWEPPNYLATINPLRAVERMHKRGWYSLYNRDL
jgi:FkbM family methyltransferase